jgi:ketosteroid isomerase-like protein
MATLYTEDAYLLPPQADLMRGRAAIQQFWQRRVSKSKT